MGNSTVLVTGAAGFIGFNLSSRLLKAGYSVVGIDNLNDYYDVELKQSRLDELFEITGRHEGEFEFFKVDLEDALKVKQIFKRFKPSYVINLAAQAGVRYSLENPIAYINSNIIGFVNVLESCREISSVKHLVYASSSSVYGGNITLPFSESHNVDHPVSLYAASKKANELIAHSYSHLFNIPSTGLRFFTVYGPWGRPDMALYLFTKAMLEDKPIKIFNNGDMIRDFTYIDDICESMMRLLVKPPSSSKDFGRKSFEPSTSWAPHQVFNIGNSNPVKLMSYISALENALGIQARKQMLPMQPGDVYATFAETSKLENYIDFRPSTPVEEGISKFVAWYRNYYGI